MAQLANPVQLGAAKHACVQHDSAIVDNKYHVVDYTQA